MKFDIVNALKYYFYEKYRYTKACMLGPVSFDEHIDFLHAKNCVVSMDSKCKRIVWEDTCTLYVIRFSLAGNFQMFDRQIWFQYKWFTKRILMDTVLDKLVII